MVFDDSVLHLLVPFVTFQIALLHCTKSSKMSMSETLQIFDRQRSKYNIFKSDQEKGTRRSRQPPLLQKSFSILTRLNSSSVR